MQRKAIPSLMTSIFTVEGMADIQDMVAAGMVDIQDMVVEDMVADVVGTAVIQDMVADVVGTAVIQDMAVAVAGTAVGDVVVGGATAVVGAA